MESSMGDYLKNTLSKTKSKKKNKLRSTLFPLSRNAVHNWLSRVYQIEALK